MKKWLILSVLFLSFAVSAFAQPLKSTGIWYFQGAPNTNPTSTRGVEVAVSIDESKVYVWDRSLNQWLDIVSQASLDQEEVEDIIADLLVRSSHDGVSVSYDDINGTLSISADVNAQRLIDSLTAVRSDIPSSLSELTNDSGYITDPTDADANPANEIQTIDESQLVGADLQLSLSNDGEATKVIDLSSLQDGTGTDDQTAAEVSVSPFGNLTSTDVQSGLLEQQGYIDALSNLSGMPLLSEDFGTFPGLILPDNQTAKSLYQIIETELQEHLDSIAALRGDIDAGGGGLTGTLTERYIPVADASGNLVDGIIFQGSRGIGIGTTDLSGPFDERLVIRGDLSGTSGRTAIILENNNTTSASIFSMLNADGQRLSMQNSASGYSTGAIGSVGTNNDLDLFFTTGGNSPTGGTGDFAIRLGGFSVTPQFTINLAGGSGVDKPANVGIMTTDPQFTLDVNAPSGIRLGRGTTAQRGVGTAAYLNWNTTTGAWDGHNSTSFGRLYLSSDVTPTNGQIRFFNSSTGMYEPTDLTITTALTPTSTADATGDQGDIAYDDDYIYIKTSAGWKRSALSTF